MRVLYSVVAVVALVACEVPEVPDDLPSTYIPSPSPTTYDVAVHLEQEDDPRHAVTYSVAVSSCGDFWQGTAVAVDAHTLVTNRHVVGNLDTSEVTITDIHGEILFATVTAISTRADLAVIASDEALPVTATLADSNAALADRVLRVGYPSGDFDTSTGIVANYTRLDEFPNVQVLVSTAEGDPGSSGSPVFDSEGQIVGIHFGIRGDGYTLSMPVSEVHRILSGKDTRPPGVPVCD